MPLLHTLCLHLTLQAIRHPSLHHCCPDTRTSHTSSSIIIAANQQNPQLWMIGPSKSQSTSGSQHNVNNSQHNSKCNHSHSHQHLHYTHHCDYDPVSHVHVHSHTAIAPQHSTTNRHSALACQLVCRHRYWDGVKANVMLHDVIQWMYIPPSTAYYQPNSRPSPPPVLHPPVCPFIAYKQTNYTSTRVF
jgi:hypothetical protein